MAAPVPQPQTNQPMPPQGQAQPTQMHKDVEIDPIVKVKQFLLPRLKEALVTLMKVAGQILQQNTLTEDGQLKSQEGLQQAYERSMEDFYTICDQMEVNLRLALEMQAQQVDSNKYTPLPVTLPKSDTSINEQQSVPYPQFLSTVKQQITCAKDMYDLLAEFTRNLLREKPPTFS